MFGQMDIVLIGGIFVLLFGPKKIPDLMKSLGGGIREFKKAQADLFEEEEVRKPIVTYEKKEKSEESKS